MPPRNFTSQYLIQLVFNGEHDATRRLNTQFCQHFFGFRRLWFFIRAALIIFTPYIFHGEIFYIVSQDYPAFVAVILVVVIYTVDRDVTATFATRYRFSPKKQRLYSITKTLIKIF